MGDRIMGKNGGQVPLPWKCCKVLFCISSYSKTLSRPIINALFSQFFAGSTPGLSWKLSSPDPLPTPEQNSVGAHGTAVYCCCHFYNVVFTR